MAQWRFMPLPAVLTSTDSGHQHAGELRHRLKNGENHVLNSGRGSKWYLPTPMPILTSSWRRVIAFEDDQKDTCSIQKSLLILSNRPQWDKGGSSGYRQLDSLSDYIVVSQETRLADHYPPTQRLVDAQDHRGNSL